VLKAVTGETDETGDSPVLSKWTRDVLNMRGGTVFEAKSCHWRTEQQEWSETPTPDRIDIAD
jgi:hypothetical protein